MLAAWFTPSCCSHWLNSTKSLVMVPNRRICFLGPAASISKTHTETSLVNLDPTATTIDYFRALLFAQRTPTSMQSLSRMLLGRGG